MEIYKEYRKYLNLKRLKLFPNEKNSHQDSVFESFYIQSNNMQEQSKNNTKEF